MIIIIVLWCDMNYSKQRELILSTLRANAVHPTAEFIHGVLKKKNPNISLATVYRNLNQLAALGTIKKIEGLEQSVHYDHNTHEHYHFICDKCKKVFDIGAEVAPDIELKILAQTGFKILGHEITFHGLCAECR